MCEKKIDAIGMIDAHAPPLIRIVLTTQSSDA